MGLEELRKEIISEAEAKVKAILEEANKEADRILKEAKEKAETIKIGKKERLMKELNEREESENALARIEGKRLVFESRLEVMDRVFNSVVERLRGFRGKEDYYDGVLVRYVVEGVSSMGLDEVYLFVNDEDYTMLSKRLKDFNKKVSSLVKRDVNIMLSEERTRILGGVILSNESGSIIFNNSFDSRLNEAKEKLVAELFEILFGER